MECIFSLYTVENGNNQAQAYSHKGSVITIQMDQHWLLSVWLGWLINYFRISESDFDISQSPQNRILTSLRVSKNSPSDVIFLGESHFSNFYSYNFSPTHSYCMIWWLDLTYFSNSTYLLNYIHNNLTCINMIWNVCIYIVHPIFSSLNIQNIISELP